MGKLNIEKNLTFYFTQMKLKVKFLMKRSDESVRWLCFCACLVFCFPVRAFLSST